MDVRLPEIPLKLLSVFVDVDGEIRVKEDFLREVLSSFRSSFGEVVDLLRGEFVEEVNAVRSGAESSHEQLLQDMQTNFSSTKEFRDLEAFVQRLDNDMMNIQRQMKSVKQMTTSFGAGTLSVGTAPLSPSPSMLRVSEEVRDVRASSSGREVDKDITRIERDIKELQKSQEDLLEMRDALVLKLDFEVTQRQLEEQLMEAKTKIMEEISRLQQQTSVQQQNQDDVQLLQQLATARSEALEQRQEELRQEQVTAVEQLRHNLEEEVAHLLSLNEDLKTADMAQVEQLTTIFRCIDDVKVDLDLRARGVWVERLDAEQAELKKQLEQENQRLSDALQKIWPSLERSDEKERKLEAWSQQAAKQLQAVRAANGELIDDFQKVAKKAKEDEVSYSQRHQALTADHEKIRASLEFKELSHAEHMSMVEERLETLEMDLARETRRIEDKAEEQLHFLAGKMRAMEENAKDREQAVLFGARCLSCNRAYEDTLKTSGAVNLPGEKRKAQVFAEIQRALHSPRTDPQEPIKLIAVKVGRPCPSPSSKEGPFASRDYSSMAYGIEDVQLLPVRARSSVGRNSGPSRSKARDLCTTPRPMQSPVERHWTFGRAVSTPAPETVSPVPGESRLKTKEQAFEDLKAAIS